MSSLCSRSPGNKRLEAFVREAVRDDTSAAGGCDRGVLQERLKALSPAKAVQAACASR